MKLNGPQQNNKSVQTPIAKNDLHSLLIKFSQFCNEKIIIVQKMPVLDIR